MANTSATGGYLSPVNPALPIGDLVFEDQLQAIIVGITGLPPTMVRPRWQPIPPKQPEPNMDWCAVGIMDVTPEGDPVVIHRSEGEGHDELQIHELIRLLCSFYGPNGQRNAGRLRDGLYIPQNREVMRAQGMGLMDVGRAINAPDLLNNQWVRRADLEVRVRRQVDRTYSVLNLLSAQGTIYADAHPQDWNTENV